MARASTSLLRAEASYSSRGPGQPRNEQQQYRGRGRGGSGSGSGGGAGAGGGRGQQQLPYDPRYQPPGLPATTSYGPVQYSGHGSAPQRGDQGQATSRSGPQTNSPNYVTTTSRPARGSANPHQPYSHQQYPESASPFNNARRPSQPPTGQVGGYSDLPTSTTRQVGGYSDQPTSTTRQPGGYSDQPISATRPTSHNVDSGQDRPSQTSRVPASDTRGDEALRPAGGRDPNRLDNESLGYGRTPPDPSPLSVISSYAPPSGGRRPTLDSNATTPGSRGALPIRTSEGMRERQFDPNLNPLLRHFAIIPRGDYANVATFVRENPNVLQSDPQLLLDEAARAYAFPKREYGDSCVQQAVILRQLRRRSLDGRRRDPTIYFRELRDDQSTTRGDFYNDFDEDKKEAKEKAKSVSAGCQLLYYGPQGQEEDVVRAGTESGPSLVQRQPHESESSVDTFRSAAAGYNSHDVETAPFTQHRSQFAQRQPLPDVQQHLTLRLATFMTPGHPCGPLDNHAGDNITSTSIEHSAPPRRQSGLIPSTNSTLLRPIPMSTVRGEDTAAPPNADTLDPRFILHRSAFYRVGRVFAVVWHQAWSETAKPPANPPANSRLTYTSGPLTIGPWGQKIHTTVRRMVVVSARKGFCVCIQINTYAGRGLAKFRNSDEDVQAHSIIFMEDTQPIFLTDEPRTRRNSIAVVKAKPELRLEPASRLCYARPHSVEHTVKSMDIGVITGDYLKDVLDYFAQINNFR